jgi:Na+(H+)/acetate symporter ActP
MVGLLSALIALALGPSIWVAVLHHAAAIFPYQYPTLLSLPLALTVAVAVSLLNARAPQNA